MNTDSIAELQRVAGAEHAIPAELCSRIRGSKFGEMRTDAAAMARLLGKGQ